MSTRQLSVVWSPIRAFAALFFSAIILGGLGLASVFALLAGTLIFNASGLMFQLLIAGTKILAPLFLAILILTSGLLGFCRSARA